MTLHIGFDTSDFRDQLAKLGHSGQAEYAISLAINTLLKKIQQSVRYAMTSRIALRRAAWNLQAIKIANGDWATKRNLSGRVHIDPRSENLYRLETGAEHKPNDGKRYLLMPSTTVFGKKIIGSNNPLNVKNLRLTDAPGGGKRGLHRTFMVQPKTGGDPLILQRTKAASSKRKGKRGTTETGARLLYRLVDRTKTDDKLDFRELAVKIVEQNIKQALADAMAKAIESAKR